MVFGACARFGWLVACLLCAFAATARAQDADAEIARDDEISELRRKLDTVVGELETLRAQIGAPEPGDAGELESRYGLGPGASKIYSLSRGVSIGGYDGAYGTTVLQSGTTYHVVCTYDGNNMRIHINGVLERADLVAS